MAKGDSSGGGMSSGNRQWQGMPSALSQQGGPTPTQGSFGPSADILGKLFGQSQGNPFQSGTTFQPPGMMGGMSGNTLQGAQAMRPPGLQYPTNIGGQSPMVNIPDWMAKMGIQTFR